jgi:hypothetical protein
MQSELTVDAIQNREGRAETKNGLAAMPHVKLRKPCGRLDGQRRIGLMARAVTAMN